MASNAASAPSHQMNTPTTWRTATIHGQPDNAPKTTIDLIGTFGVLPLSPTLDTPRPIARDVGDAALLLSVLRGEDRRGRHAPGSISINADRHLCECITAVTGNPATTPSHAGSLHRAEALATGFLRSTYGGR
jgi:hypothetical protein